MMADVLALEMVGPTLLSVLESLDAQSDPGSLRECLQCIFVQVLYAFENFGSMTFVRCMSAVQISAGVMLQTRGSSWS